MEAGIIVVLIYLVIACVSIAVYFIPTFIAFSRNRSNKVAIFCMNFFLGWMVIGWIIGLIWAVADDNHA